MLDLLSTFMRAQVGLAIFFMPTIGAPAGSAFRVVVLDRFQTNSVASDIASNRGINSPGPFICPKALPAPLIRCFADSLIR